MVSLLAARPARAPVRTSGDGPRTRVDWPVGVRCRGTGTCYNRAATGGSNSVAEWLLPKQQVVGSNPISRSRLPVSDEPPGRAGGFFRLPVPCFPGVGRFRLLCCWHWQPLLAALGSSAIVALPSRARFCSLSPMLARSGVDPPGIARTVASGARLSHALSGPVYALVPVLAFPPPACPHRVR